MIGFSSTPRVVKPGDPITDTGWNSIVANVLFNRAIGPTLQSIPMLVTNTTGEDIAADSVFSFDDEGAFKGQEANVQAKKGGGKLILTNQTVGIRDGDTGRAQSIGTWPPTRVLSDGTPTAGNTCGPTASGWVAAASGSGLVALTNPDAENYIWVAASPTGGAAVRFGYTPSGQSISAASGPANARVAGSGTVQPVSLSGAIYSDDGSPIVIANPWVATIPELVFVAWQDDEKLELLGADCEVDGPQIATQEVAGPVAITDDLSDPPWTDTGLNLIVPTVGDYSYSIGFNAQHTLGNNQIVAGRVQFSVGGPPSGTGAGTPVGDELTWGFGRQSTFADFPVNLSGYIENAPAATIDMYATNMGDGTLDLVNMQIQSRGPL